MSRERHENESMNSFKWFFSSYEAVEEEEAFMIKRQLELDIHNRRINDFIFLTKDHKELHFTQQEFISLL